MYVNLVDLVKNFLTSIYYYLAFSIYLQTSASIQPRTSLSKFAKKYPKARKRVRTNINSYSLVVFSQESLGKSCTHSPPKAVRAAGRVTFSPTVLTPAACLQANTYRPSEAVVSEGDCILIPAGWYHQVATSAERSVAVNQFFERP